MELSSARVAVVLTAALFCCTLAAQAQVDSPLKTRAAPPTPGMLYPPNGGKLPQPTAPLTVQVSDPDNVTLDVSFYGREVAGSSAAPFTIVVLPDTQYYSASYPATFNAQTQWIVDHRTTLNIAYVAHEGDLVDDSADASQWYNANAAISILDTLPDLPYGLCIGNHDYAPPSNLNASGVFNSYFPYTRYQSRSWYGGHYGTNNDNHYILFSAGGMDFIAIHLKYGAGWNPVLLNWAGSVLAAYPSRRAIVVEHDLLTFGLPAPWEPQGQLVYDALKVYPNMFLMLCGHINGTGMRSDSYNGHTIYSVLADYQWDPNGGNGYLRIMQFVPASSEIRVSTYSPTLDQYKTDSGNWFTLSYDMDTDTFTELGAVSGVASDADVELPWGGLAPGRTYQWYTTVSDGSETVSGPVWSFVADSPQGGLTGDANCDGQVNFDDINPFVAALVGQASYEAQYPGCRWLNGDANGDGTVDFDDINPFVQCLVAGSCP